MNNIRLSLSTAVVLAAVPAMAFANTGHSDTAYSATELLHYITSPIHAIPIAVMFLFGAAVVVRKLRVRKTRQSHSE